MSLKRKNCRGFGRLRHIFVRTPSPTSTRPGMSNCSPELPKQLSTICIRLAFASEFTVIYEKREKFAYTSDSSADISWTFSSMFLRFICIDLSRKNCFHHRKYLLKLFKARLTTWNIRSSSNLFTRVTGNSITHFEDMYGSGNRKLRLWPSTGADLDQNHFGN